VYPAPPARPAAAPPRVAGGFDVLDLEREEPR
jgi:hypothetical protein